MPARIARNSNADTSMTRWIEASVACSGAGFGPMQAPRSSGRRHRDQFNSLHEDAGIESVEMAQESEHGCAIGACHLRWRTGSEEDGAVESRSTASAAASHSGEAARRRRIAVEVGNRLERAAIGHSSIADKPAQSKQAVQALPREWLLADEFGNNIS